MLEINHSVLARPQILNTYLFSAPTQTQFSSPFYALCKAALSHFYQFTLNSSAHIIHNKAGWLRVEEINFHWKRAGIKSFLIDQEQIINL